MTQTVLKTLLLCGSVLATFLSLEVTYRLLYWEWVRINFLENELHFFWAAYPVQHDPLLGWVPREGVSLGQGWWGSDVRVVENGLRSNGQKVGEELAGSPSILAVGDSFTWGAEVSDSETWPAILERLLKIQVHNAGVFGYGLDQSYLRARSLLPEYKPDILIVSLIPDDILRCELAERSGVGKPYFQLTDGQLELKNTPVSRPVRRQLGAFRRLTGYSLFCYKLLRKVLPRYYLEGSFSRTAAHTQGQRIACRLLWDHASAAARDQVELVVLIQYGKEPSPDSHALIARLCECLSGAKLLLVDLRGPLKELEQLNSKGYAEMFTGHIPGHMTAAGNAFVAQVLRDTLRQLPVLREGTSLVQQRPLSVPQTRIIPPELEPEVLTVR